MTKSLIRNSVLATAIAAAMLTAPFAAPPAVADPPAWAPAHGYRSMHRHDHGKYKRKHHHERRHWHRHDTRRTVYYYPRPIHDHRGHRHVNRSEIGISPSLGGAIIGGLLGGLGGSQIGSGSGRTAAIIGGVAVGAVIGGSIGSSMEAADRARVQQTLETTPTGQTVIWNNPDTGNRYEMTPTRTYRTADRRDCREYTTWVFIGGYEEQVTGTACRMPDGSWQRQAS